MSLYLGEKLISGIGQDRIADTLPIGAIIEWDSDLIPENWLLLNGQAVSRTVYSELFAIYGTTYGAGDGSTTFNLPDRRTRVAVGRDANDEDFAALGITGGKKDAVLPAHTHTRGTMDITGSISALGGSEFKFGTPTGAFWCTNTVDYYAATTNTSGSTRYDGMNFQASRNWTGETSEEGQDASSGNLQPYIVTNFIVKAKLYTTEFIGGNIVIDNLTSDSSVNVLSARMGKELHKEVRPIEHGGTGANNIGQAANNLSVKSLGAGIKINDNENLNDFSEYGNYYCSGNSTAATLLNCPIKNAFTMSVGRATGSSENYTYQEIVEYGSGLRWYRMLINSSWNGWRVSLDETNGVTMKLVWENANPTSEFKSQKINMDLSEYTHVLAVFKFATTTNYYISHIGINGVASLVSFSYGSANGVYAPYRNFTAQSSGVTFGSAWNPVANTETQSDLYLIPYRVYGIKGVL